LHSMRKGRSVTPAIGATKSRPGNSCAPKRKVGVGNKAGWAA
jgi:hypothetical protein